VVDQLVAGRLSNREVELGVRAEERGRALGVAGLILGPAQLIQSEQQLPVHSPGREPRDWWLKQQPHLENVADVLEGNRRDVVAATVLESDQFLLAQPVERRPDSGTSDVITLRQLFLGDLTARR